MYMKILSSLATLTQTHEFKCRLKVGDEELTFGQFRTEVLEDPFFNF
jgi:hypothetical protein